jgi:hypothetical protein
VFALAGLCRFTHFDLTGDGSSDQSGATFFQDKDAAVDSNNEFVDD